MKGSDGNVMGRECVSDGMVFCQVKGKKEGCLVKEGERRGTIM